MWYIVFKLSLPYDYGLNKIYSFQHIEKAKQLASFEREFNLKFVGNLGSLFSPMQIEKCINLGSEFSTDKVPVSVYSFKGCGVDPAFSSSAFGLVTLEHIKTEDKDIIRVIDCPLIEKTDPNQMAQLCWDIWTHYRCMNTVFFIDRSNRAMVNLLN